MVYLNTEAIVQLVRQAAKEHEKVENAYFTEVERLGKYEGSLGYADGMEEIRQTYNGAVKDLRKHYAPKIDKVLQSMRKSLESVRLEPPTDEALRILELVGIVESPSAQLLSKAAQSVRDCPTALNRLREIARAKGITTAHIPLSNDLDTEHASRQLRGAVSNINRFWTAIEQPYDMSKPPQAQSGDFGGKINEFHARTSRKAVRNLTSFRELLFTDENYDTLVEALGSDDYSF